MPWLYYWGRMGSPLCGKHSWGFPYCSFIPNRSYYIKVKNVVVLKSNISSTDIEKE